MRLKIYILLILIFTTIHISSVAYTQEKSTGIHQSKQRNFTEVNKGEDSQEIHLKKEEFNEIIDQLAGMKTLLEEMKRDYDSRLHEMQEKIFSLEREKAQLTDDALLSRSVVDEPERMSSQYVKKDEFEKAMNRLQDTEKQLEDVELKYESSLNEDQGYSAPGQVNPDLASQQWSPTAPINLWSSGRNYMNMSFDGLFSAGASTEEDTQSLFGGGHDPNQRGFTLQQLETTFQGAVDPYFYGQAHIIFLLDDEGESSIEVEEAYLTSMALPFNLQVKAGTFFTEFGRFNPTHPHAWGFVDQPLVNNRFLGSDGLRNPGTRLSWLAPTENYTELFIAVQDSQGETAHSFRGEEAMFGREPIETNVHNLKDMLYTPRVVTSFDLTGQQTLMFGSSASFGPNSTGTDRDTIIYGADLYWRWKSRYADAGYPFLSWQTEVMGRRFEAGKDEERGLTEQVFHNWGTYSQVLWGFKKRWVAGFRTDYVDGLKEIIVKESERLRLSPNITFYPTEFSKIRLQYDYDNILGRDRTEHSVFVQFEILLGSHGAHKF